MSPDALSDHERSVLIVKKLPPVTWQSFRENPVWMRRITSWTEYIVGLRGFFSEVQSNDALTRINNPSLPLMPLDPTPDRPKYRGKPDLSKGVSFRQPFHVIFVVVKVIIKVLVGLLNQRKDLGIPKLARAEARVGTAHRQNSTALGHHTTIVAARDGIAYKRAAVPGPIPGPRRTGRRRRVPPEPEEGHPCRSAPS